MNDYGDRAARERADNPRYYWKIFKEHPIMRCYYVLPLVLSLVQAVERRGNERLAKFMQRL